MFYNKKASSKENKSNKRFFTIKHVRVFLNEDLLPVRKPADPGDTRAY